MCAFLLADPGKELLHEVIEDLDEESNTVKSCIVEVLPGKPFLARVSLPSIKGNLVDVLLILKTLDTIAA